MKEKISRISLIVYAILCVLSFFLLCTPGGSVSWLAFMGLFAIPPLIAGPRKYRILGTIALAVAIVAITGDYTGGKRYKAKLHKLMIHLEQQQNQQRGEQSNSPYSSPVAGSKR